MPSLFWYADAHVYQYTRCATRVFISNLKAFVKRVAIPRSVVGSAARPAGGFTFPFDAELYRFRNVIERTFCRLKDFRGIATRYDKLARNFLAALCLVAAICFRIN